MIRDDDVNDRALTGITTLQADLERAARTRRRCRSIIERRAQASSSPTTVTRHTEPPTVAWTAAHKLLVGTYCILCVVYVLSLVLTTVRLQVLSR